jgi:hypothetical protein
MTNDFATDLANEIVEYVTGGTDIPAASATYYVTLYDDTGTELNGDLQNGRVGVGNASWTKNGTAFENASEVNFGDATSDITVQEFAIKDSDADDATARELYRADVTNAPESFSNGTRIFFAAGELSVDVLD